MLMRDRRIIAAAIIAAFAWAAAAKADDAAKSDTAKYDPAKYPDWSGQWKRPPGAGIQWDQTKRPGRDQQPRRRALRQPRRPVPNKS